MFCHLWLGSSGIHKKHIDVLVENGQSAVGDVCRLEKKVLFGIS